MNDDDLRSLIDRIHDAALEPQAWMPVVEAFSDRFAGSGGTIMFVTEHIDDQWMPVQSYLTRFDSRIFELSSAQYATRETNPMLRVMPSLPINRYFSHGHFISEAELLRSDFYHDILKPLGVLHTGVCLMPLDEIHQAVINFEIPKAAVDIDEDSIAAFNFLVPHVKRSFQVQHRLRLLEQERDAAFAALDEVPLGVVLVDAGGQVLFANRAAVATLDQRDGLSLWRKRLQAATPGRTAKLERLIGEAAATAEGRGLGAGGALSLPRPSLKRPLALLVAPLRGANGSFSGRNFTGRRAAAVVFVSDPESNIETPTEMLARLYRLTPAEARLAGALLAGEGLQSAADRLCITLETARSHLKRIFDKTGTRRQAELVALLLKGLAGFSWN